MHSQYCTPIAKLQENLFEDNPLISMYKLEHGCTSLIVCNDVGIRAKFINQHLNKISYGRFDSINVEDNEYISNSIDIIYFLVCQNIKLSQNNARLVYNRKKADEFSVYRQQLIQSISKDKRAISIQKEALKAKKQQMQDKYKSNLTKITQQRDELLKQVRKIQSKQKAFEVQFRKKDNQIRCLHDSIKKIQQKNQSKCHTFVVNQTIVTPIDINRQQNTAKQQFNALALAKIEETFKQIFQQNQKLKQYFLKFIIELNTVFETSNQTFRKTRNFITDQQLQLAIITPQAFKLPIQYSRQNIEQTFKNLTKLKQILKIKLKPTQIQTQRVSNNQAKQSGGACQYCSNKQIKVLMQNYKEVIKSQQQVINQIMKKNQIINDIKTQPDQQLYQKQCFYDHQQMMKTQQAINKQILNIQSKNKLLQATKRKVNQSIIKTQKIRINLMQQSTVFPHYCYSQFQN